MPGSGGDDRHRVSLDCHPRESGGPGQAMERLPWIPAFAGMTGREVETRGAEERPSNQREPQQRGGLIMRRFMLPIAGAVALTLAAGSVRAAEVEVLHWWTSGGEAAALNVLKKDLEAKGITWKDMPVAGGGGTQAMTVLRARVSSGQPPTAVQMLGFDILDWAQQGVLGDLNELAAQEKWDSVVPAPLQKFSKYQGNWIAAPVNVHSTNWIWANKAVFDKLGISQPTNWDELIAALDKIKAAGLIPLAHGGQPWQDATIFDSVVLTTGGADFYKKALIDLDADALGSDTMKTVFDRMAKL